MLVENSSIDLYAGAFTLGLMKEKWLCTITHFPPMRRYTSVMFQRASVCSALFGGFP